VVPDNVFRGFKMIETPNIRSILNIRIIQADDPTQATTFRIICQSSTDVVEIPIMHTAAVELETALHNLPLAQQTTAVA
jgi:hypothetical protein